VISDRTRVLVIDDEASGSISSLRMPAADIDELAVTEATRP